ncbi:Transposase [Carnobacterium iners]|nr:Transposase [Carnobacterium iners]
MIDMNMAYLTLIYELFPKIKIIIDTFHLVKLIGRSLDKARIKIMNHYRTSNSEDLENLNITGN